MQGKTEKNAYIPIFELKFFLRSERKRSRAENFSARTMARASSARTHHYYVHNELCSYQTKAKNCVLSQTKRNKKWHLFGVIQSYWSSMIIRWSLAAWHLRKYFDVRYLTGIQFFLKMDHFMFHFMSSLLTWDVVILVLIILKTHIWLRDF